MKEKTTDDFPSPSGAKFSILFRFDRAGANGDRSLFAIGWGSIGSEVEIEMDKVIRDKTPVEKDIQAFLSIALGRRSLPLGDHKRANRSNPFPHKDLADLDPPIEPTK